MTNRITNRIKKVFAASQKYEYDIEEARKDAINGLDCMLKKVNEWYIRDTICKITKRDFYRGKSYDSLTEKDAEKIIEDLINFVASTPNEDAISDIYEISEKYNTK